MNGKYSDGKPLVSETVLIGMTKKIVHSVSCNLVTTTVTFSPINDTLLSIKKKKFLFHACNLCFLEKKLGQESLDIYV
jgi:hypothetical protein